MKQMKDVKIILGKVKNQSYAISVIKINMQSVKPVVSAMDLE